MELTGLILEGKTAKDWLLMAMYKCVHTKNIVQVFYCIVSKTLFATIQLNTLKSSNVVFLSSLSVIRCLLGYVSWHSSHTPRQRLGGFFARSPTRGPFSYGLVLSLKLGR